MRPATVTETIVEKKAATPKIVKAETLFERMKELYKAIEEKAYGLFEKRGFKDGSDREDWFKAEDEILRFVPVEFKETTDELVVTAEIPGFKAEELKVSVEPTRIIICGEAIREQKEEKDKLTYREYGGKELFRNIALPCDVDYEKATATLTEDRLEIKMPKVVTATKQVEVKTV